MSLKTRLRISIVALVTIIVVGLSALYLYDFTSIAFDAADKRIDLVQNEVKAYVLERIETVLRDRDIHPVTLADSKQAWTAVVRSDRRIPRMLQRMLAATDIVVDIHITGEDGALLATSAHSPSGGLRLPDRDFHSLLRRNSFRNLWELMTRREDYVQTLGLGVPEQQKPVFKIAVVVRSTLLKNTIVAVLGKLMVAFSTSLLVAVLLAYLLPTLVLNPLERIGRSIDLIRTGEFEAVKLPEKHQETREFAAIQSKLSLLGQQFQGAKQDALQLRSNVEEMLQRLEEAVLLFDASGLLMMAGHPAGRLLGKSQEEMTGKKLPDLFPPSTVLGGLIQDAIQKNSPLHDHPAIIDHNGAGATRVLANMELLRNGVNGEEIGTLITLRDAESRIQLERQLDLSTRLAAISKLMGGVAHEIKNPLNAMALHLEVLKSRLEENDPEIAVISAEIKRLDRVVKTFLNFNKPLDLQMKVLDAGALCGEVANLVSPEAGSRGIEVETDLLNACWINGDSDLLKQAVLNVVMNALEAMPSGGRLRIRIAEDSGEHIVQIFDNGPGIPPEIRDKIFNLYFSTKATGTGMGLAMAFRILQLHGGTIEFSSELGKGTLFQLRLPALTALEAGRAVERAHT